VGRRRIVRGKHPLDHGQRGEAGNEALGFGQALPCFSETSRLCGNFRSKRKTLGAPMPHPELEALPFPRCGVRHHSAASVQKPNPNHTQAATPVAMR
jgi:hypothetical protein